MLHFNFDILRIFMVIFYIFMCIYCLRFKIAIIFFRILYVWCLIFRSKSFEEDLKKQLHSSSLCSILPIPPVVYYFNQSPLILRTSRSHAQAPSLALRPIFARGGFRLAAAGQATSYNKHLVHFCKILFNLIGV